jgi:two-component system, LytTR family, response regulator
MTRVWRVAIVDDEPIARRGLRRMVERVPCTDLVGEAGSGPEAVRLLRDLHPDIVFLDVNLPGGDAFDVLARAPLESAPTIVLVTAFEEYAARAFDLDVADYLLKPFDDARFHRAWTRACAARGAPHTAPAPGTLLLRRDGRLHVISIAEIEWIEAADNYVRVHTSRGMYLWRQALRVVADRLATQGFLRVHRSGLVNALHVAEVEATTSGDGRLRLRRGTEVTLSRRYRQAVELALRGS